MSDAARAARRGLGIVAVGVSIVATVIAVVQPTLLGTILALAAIVALLIVGVALCALAYRLVGRWLRDFGTVGAYAAGLVTALPFAIAADIMGRIGYGDPALAPPGAVDWATAILIWVVGGVAMGYAMRRPPRA